MNRFPMNFQQLRHNFANSNPSLHPVKMTISNQSNHIIVKKKTVSSLCASFMMHIFWLSKKRRDKTLSFHLGKQIRVSVVMQQAFTSGEHRVTTGDKPKDSLFYSQS